ncbi:GNAT family N-acetyltransferase [Idiomarina abyssalis]|uniref:GNAT family N-acetyltransferase n=1 Tax=Idiomarina abyssalis TaxID=86102 RepID=UPI003A8E4465
MHRKLSGDELSITPLASVDTLKILDLLCGSLSTVGATAKTAKFWQWKHEDNPFGVSVGLCAHSTGNSSLVAVRPFMKWALRLPDQSVVCALRPVDTVTHPDWRGKGLFTKLTRAAIDDVDKDSAKLLFNTPNSSSFPGYIKLGWSCAEELAVAIKINRVSHFVSRFLLNRRIEVGLKWSNISAGGTKSATSVSENELNSVLAWCAEADDRRPAVGLRTFRNIEFLKWRYVDQPNVDYGFFIRKRDDGQLESVVVVRLEERKGIVGALIQDVFLGDSTEKSVANALKCLGRDLNVGFLAAHFAHGTNEYSALRRNLFFPVKKIKLATRSLSEDGKFSDSSEFGSWDLSLSDIEVF